MDWSSSLPDPFPIPFGGVVRGRLRPPPSKSISLRALNLALLGGKPLTIRNLLQAEDTRAFLVALQGLGWTVGVEGGEWRVRPPRTAADRATIDCEESGTMLRFLTAALTSIPGSWRISGSRRLQERPIGPLIGALRELGARIRYLGSEGFAPLAIEGSRLRGGDVGIDAGQSSQFVSALAMAALRAEGPVTIHIEALTSVPYLDLTVAMLRRAGAVVETTPRAVTVAPGRPGWEEVEVEADFSAAAYPAAAAVLTRGRVTLEGLDRDSRQGDARFAELLEAIGGEVAWTSAGLEVAGSGALRAVDVDLSEMPDQVPTLAALAPFLEGETSIRNVPHLRIKESDRLAAMAAGLRAVGAPVEEMPDGLAIPGVWAGRRPPEGPVTLDSHGDHRIAMSLALVGLRRPGVSIASPEVVAKSYPGFWADFEGLLAH